MREDRDDEKTANASEEVPQKDSQGETSSNEKADISNYNGFGGG